MRKILGLVAVSALLGCSTNVEAVDTGAAESEESTGQVSSAYVNATFVLGVLGKCVDVGGDAYQAIGTPVFLYGCNSSSAQVLRSVEIPDGTHDLRLVTSKGFCIGVRGGVVGTGRALELQKCVEAPLILPPIQRFAFDGDTLFVGTQQFGKVARDRVIEVSRGRTANNTPLVVGTRDVDPAEYIRFLPVSPSMPYPTSGFVKVSTLNELDIALLQAHWGSVVEVAPGTQIRIDDNAMRYIPSGATLRGNRQKMNDGPEIYRANTQTRPGETQSALFMINTDNVRVTGLRIRGFDTTQGKTAALVSGIVSDGAGNRVLIDHNEMSGWTHAAVLADSDYLELTCASSASPQNTRVLANYFHDNSREGFGYGVTVHRGANPYIDGNTFTRNRHAIAADGLGRTGYTAMFNLVTESNSYGTFPFYTKEHDFDVHGTEGGTAHLGGQAGYGFVIASNTFLPQGLNIKIRGTVCQNGPGIVIANNRFFNVTDLGGSISLYDPSNVSLPGNTVTPEDSSTVQGDFDGDGIVDDFIGTGTAWYYRPGRTKDWRVLNRYPQRHQPGAGLTLGDFDRDGRTDVRMTTADRKILTSWGGSSPWDDGSPDPTPPPVIGPGSQLSP